MKPIEEVEVSWTQFRRALEHGGASEREVRSMRWAFIAGGIAASCALARHEYEKDGAALPRADVDLMVELIEGYAQDITEELEGVNT